MARKDKYLHQLRDVSINAFVSKVGLIIQKYEDQLEANEGQEIDVEAFETELSELMSQQTFKIPQKWHQIDGIDFNDATDPMDGKVGYLSLRQMYIDSSKMQEEIDNEIMHEQ